MHNTYTWLFQLLNIIQMHIALISFIHKRLTNFYTFSNKKKYSIKNKHTWKKKKNEFSGSHMQKNEDSKARSAKSQNTKTLKSAFHNDLLR